MKINTDIMEPLQLSSEMQQRLTFEVPGQSVFENTPCMPNLSLMGGMAHTLTIRCTH